MGAAHGSFVGALALTLVLTACDRLSPPPLPALHADLGGAAVARVGDVLLPGSLVGEVAAVQHVDVATALDRLISDALAAQGARARGDDRAPRVSWEITSILGRAVADHVRADALAAGPPTDDEIKQLTAIHWLDVDVPASMRVSHAVILRPKDASQLPAGRAAGARLAAAVFGAKDEADFEARANAVPHAGFDLRVETLPTPFVADGRFVAPDHSFVDPAFAAGAFALKKPGDISGVVESSFGWHVIRLLERFPPKILPLDQHRTQFAEEAITHRARANLDAILAARRSATHIEILPDAEVRMSGLTAVPAAEPAEPAATSDPAPP